MRPLRLICILVAITSAALCQIYIGKTFRPAHRITPAAAKVSEDLVGTVAPPAVSELVGERQPSAQGNDEPNFGAGDEQQANLEGVPDEFLSDGTPGAEDFSDLAYYAYAEIPPDRKPAVTVLESLRHVPVGTPLEEIKRVSDALGIDSAFMKAVAKIESDFDPKQRTGSYIGLYQLSDREFDKYGSGNITNSRDNAVAAAYKFAIAAKRFELDTHRKPTISDLYLVHQQGWQGAVEHIRHPERVAWQSMCATDEGREKGEKWCKRAIWRNTFPAVKRIWKSVNRLTSGAFVAMWEQRVEQLYTRYSEATPEN